MQQIVDALVARIPQDKCHSGIAVEAVEPESGKWWVISSGRTQEFDAAVIATPAIQTAKLVNRVVSLSRELKDIGYSSSVIVILEYDREVRAALPPGFGLLVPRAEGRLLGATFVHNKFPDRAPEDRALIRCFLGGTRDPSIVESSDDEIQGIVCAELARILNIRSQPLWVRIYRWEKAMAQYGVGHLERIQRIRTLLAQMPGLAVAGNAYTGIGVPDCIRSGSEAATKVLAELGFRTPTTAINPLVTSS